MGLITNEPRVDEEENWDQIGLRKLAILLQNDIERTATQLDRHTRNINISRVAGGATAVAGGVTAIVGFALIPFTLGLSAVVAGIVGASIATAGGLTAGGASITKIFIDRFKLKPLLAKWNDFNQMLSVQLLETDPEMVRLLQEELKNRMTNAANDAGIVAGTVGGIIGTAGAARVGMIVPRVAVGPAARVAVIATAGSIVLNAALIGVSLYDIIDGSIELHRQNKNRGSKAGNILRQVAKSLDDFARTGQFRDLRGGHGHSSASTFTCETYLDDSFGSWEHISLMSYSS